jgi:hypothetical protein
MLGICYRSRQRSSANRTAKAGHIQGWVVVRVGLSNQVHSMNIHPLLQPEV